MSRFKKKKKVLTLSSKKTNKPSFGFLLELMLYRHEIQVVSEGGPKTWFWVIL